MHIQRHIHTSTHVQSTHKRNNDSRAQGPGWEGRKKDFVRDLTHTHTHTKKNWKKIDGRNRFHESKTKVFKNIEFQAKLLDHFLRSNKSNINQSRARVSKSKCHTHAHARTRARTQTLSHAHTHIRTHVIIGKKISQHENNWATLAAQRLLRASTCQPAAHTQPNCNLVDVGTTRWAVRTGSGPLIILFKVISKGKKHISRFNQNSLLWVALAGQEPNKMCEFS